MSRFPTKVAPVRQLPQLQVALRRRSERGNYHFASGDARRYCASATNDFMDAKQSVKVPPMRSNAALDGLERRE
jgi:hypothetical protein